MVAESVKVTKPNFYLFYISLNRQNHFMLSSLEDDFLLTPHPTNHHVTSSSHPAFYIAVPVVVIKVNTFMPFSNLGNVSF